jgi:hypothetical protein
MKYIILSLATCISWSHPNPRPQCNCQAVPAIRVPRKLTPEPTPNPYANIKIHIANPTNAPVFNAREHLEQLANKRAADKKEEELVRASKNAIADILGEDILDAVYPNYIYCTDFTDKEECLSIEGCSWCPGLGGHCQYTYTAVLYPDPPGKQCIDGGYPLDTLPEVICGVPWARGFTYCDIPRIDAIAAEFSATAD